jgi:hypothetical protein
MVIFDQNTRQSDDIFRLVAVKPCAVDQLLNFPDVCTGERFHVRKARKQSGSYQVDAFVCALRGKYHRHGELFFGPKVQWAGRASELCLKQPENFPCASSEFRILWGFHRLLRLASAMRADSL